MADPWERSRPSTARRFLVPTLTMASLIQATIVALISLDLAIGAPILAANDATEGQRVFHVDAQSEAQMRHLADLVDTLEKLGVLDGGGQSCYTFDKITTTRELSKDNSTWTIGVHLYVEELINGKGRPGDSQGARGGQHSEKDSQNQEKSCLGQAPVEGVITQDDAQSASTVSAHTEPPVVGERGEGNDNADNGTIIAVRDEEPPNAKSQTNGTFSNAMVDETEGLSRTQIMVISTCSVVIGLFFIVALIMRVSLFYRNYMKRIREERATSKKSAYRTSSITLKGSQCSDDANAPKSPSGKTHPEDGDTCTTEDEIEAERQRAVGRSINLNNKPRLILTSSPASPLRGVNQREDTMEDTAKSVAEDRPKKRDESYMEEDPGYYSNHVELDVDFASFRLSPPGELEDIEEAPEEEDGYDVIGHVPLMPDGELTIAAITTPCDSHCRASVAPLEPTRDPLGHREPPVGSEGGGEGQAETSPPPHHHPSSRQEINLEFLAGAGFTQSDSSLNSSSCRPWYCYGNQEEYQGRPEGDNVDSVTGGGESPPPPPSLSPMGGQEEGDRRVDDLVAMDTNGTGDTPAAAMATACSGEGGDTPMDTWEHLRGENTTDAPPEAVSPSGVCAGMDPPDQRRDLGTEDNAVEPSDVNANESGFPKPATSAPRSGGGNGRDNNNASDCNSNPLQENGGIGTDPGYHQPATNGDTTPIIAHPVATCPAPFNVHPGIRAGSRLKRPLSGADGDLPRTSPRKSVTFSVDDTEYYEPLEGATASDADADDEREGDGEAEDEEEEEEGEDDAFMAPAGAPAVPCAGHRPRHHREGSREETTRLLGPEFEGMEPTYV